MQTPSHTRILRTADFAGAAIELILERHDHAIAERGLFRFGLAGGSTPRKIYEQLAALGDRIQWDKTQITFGDERCVPPDHADSNFRMANESLLSKVPIPQGNVFRIQGELPAQEAAVLCERQLNAVATRFAEERYRHDLLLLGIGEDGHTASLFPGSTALLESTKNVIPATGPKPPPQRVTFTFPLINASRTIAFLVNDPAKDAIVAEARSGQHPSGKVSPINGEIVWILGERK
jgi:6-phosphogluconolactonase